MSGGSSLGALLRVVDVSPRSLVALAIVAATAFVVLRRDGHAGRVRLDAADPYRPAR